MTRVSAPGLPIWPELFWDPEKQVAIVSAAIPTWRSRVLADRSARIAISAAWIAAGYWLWHRLVAGTGSAEALIMFGVSMAFLCPLISALAKPNLIPFFMRRLFATKTVITFSPESIFIQSRLYDQPLAVWRVWEGRPVRCRFMLEQDRYAAQAGADSPSLQQRFGGALREAMQVSLLIDTGQRIQVTPEPSFDSCNRSIPVTEADGEFATKITTVYSAAAALTSVWHTSHADLSSTTPQGVDIDLD